MKTVEDIDRDIQEQVKICKTEDRKSKINRAKKEMQLLRQYKRYLDLAEEKHLIRQLEDLRGKVFKIVDGFEIFKQANPDLAESIPHSRLKTQYHNKMGLKKIKDQIKALEYLLS